MTRNPVRSLLAAAAIVAASVGGAAAQDAGGAGGGKQDCGLDSFFGNVNGSEASGKTDIVSKDGFLGAYQIGEEKLIDLGYATRNGSTKDNVISWTGKGGVNSTSDFLSNADLQKSIYVDVKKLDWAQFSSTTKSMVGNTLPDGTRIDASGLLKGAQFGSGKVNAFFANGMNCIPGKGTPTNDGNGVCVSDFIKSGAGFDVSAITGQGGGGSGGTCGSSSSQPYSGDTTSRTCPPSVKMVQSINCALYPPSLMGFCMRYKPLQMTMDDCNRAEKYAEGAPPSGPQLDQCKKQTFGDGTGSWSYVLACAKASPASGETGQASRKVGNADDPACYERLKGLGVEFQDLGKQDISSGGRSCIIPNATRFKGTPEVQLSQAVTLNCALVEQIVQFSKAGHAAFGLTEIGVKGTTACRGINNPGGSNQAKTSLHGTGNAIDVGTLTAGGRVWHADRYWPDTSVRPFFDQVKQIGCSIFSGTLSHNFYRTMPGAWHIHWQAVESTNCDPGYGKK